MGNLEIVTLGVRHGSRLTGLTQGAFCDSLHLVHAAARRNMDSSLYLLDRLGAGLDAKDEANATPLHAAEAAGAHGCVMLLRELIAKRLLGDEPPSPIYDHSPLPSPTQLPPSNQAQHQGQLQHQSPSSQETKEFVPSADVLIDLNGGGDTAPLDRPAATQPTNPDATSTSLEAEKGKDANGGGDKKEDAVGNDAGYEGPLLPAFERRQGKFRARSLTTSIASFFKPESGTTNNEMSNNTNVNNSSTVVPDGVHRDLTTVPLDSPISITDISSLDITANDEHDESFPSAVGKSPARGKSSPEKKMHQPQRTPRAVLESILPKDITKEALKELLDGEELVTLVGMYQEMISLLNEDLIVELAERERLVVSIFFFLDFDYFLLLFIF